MPPPSLRPGLTEASFRRYERILQKACECYPTPYKLHLPEGQSELTTAARLRDAVRSYRQFNWPLTWDGSNLLRFSVHHTTDGIFISGAKKLETSAPQRSNREITPITPVDAPVPEFTLTDLESYAHLISRKLLKGPITFTLPPHINPYTLEALFDVAVVQETSGRYILT